MTAAMETVSIYNLPAQPPRWDRLGVFFITFCAVWTALVAAGMLFMWFNRHVPLLRVRGLPLFLTSIALLHLYWILAQLVYPIGASMPVTAAYNAQFLVMGILFPLGIALFHAANLRFLHVAELQKQFLQPGPRSRARRKARFASRTWVGWFRGLSYNSKVLVAVGFGMLIQTTLCIAVWLVCKKYHPSFGVPGTEVKGETIPEQLIDMGRGWEWWPSLFWQLFWTWIVAPFLIWRAWDIRDTLGWRTQTIGACIAGLHAVPMFLITLYAPIFTTINMYWPPSQWIHLTTFILEIFTIFLPCAQLLRQKLLQKRITTQLGLRPDTPHPHPSSAFHARPIAAVNSTLSVFSDDLKTRNSSISSGTFPTPPCDYLHGFSDDIVFTMSSLERMLDEHPLPLQTFSASRDFSGENIAFLIRVAQWKTSFLLARYSPETTLLDNPAKRASLFASGLDIYTDLVSMRDADFPLNLLARDRRKLEDIFEDAARERRGQVDVDEILPFEAQERMIGDWKLQTSSTTHTHTHPKHPSTTSWTEKDTLAITTTSSTTSTTFSATASSSSSSPPASPVIELQPTTIKNTTKTTSSFSSSSIDSQYLTSDTPYTGPIPPDFDERVFDSATSSIKCLVLTNTWPKFVDEMRRGRGRGSMESV